MTNVIVVFFLRSTYVGKTQFLTNPHSQELLDVEYENIAMTNHPPQAPNASLQWLSPLYWPCASLCLKFHGFFCHSRGRLHFPQIKHGGFQAFKMLWEFYITLQWQLSRSDQHTLHLPLHPCWRGWMDLVTRKCFAAYYVSDPGNIKRARSSTWHIPSWFRQSNFSL